MEGVEATAIKHELEGSVGRWCGEKVQCGKAAVQGAAFHPGAGSFHGERGDIDSEHVETAIRHPNGVGAGPRPDFERWTWGDRARSNELDEQRFWVPGVPRQVSRRVAFIPGWVRHLDTSLVVP